MSVCQFSKNYDFSKIVYLLTSSCTRIVFYRIRKIFQVIVAFLEALFCQFKPTVHFCTSRAKRGECRKHSGRKFTKMCPQKQDNYLENFPDSVENDETKLHVSMYLCWMKSSISWLVTNRLVNLVKICI